MQGFQKLHFHFHIIYITDNIPILKRQQIPRMVLLPFLCDPKSYWYQVYKVIRIIHFVSKHKGWEGKYRLVPSLAHNILSTRGHSTYLLASFLLSFLGGSELRLSWAVEAYRRLWRRSSRQAHFLSLQPGREVKHQIGQPHCSPKHHGSDCCARWQEQNGNVVMGDAWTVSFAAKDENHKGCMTCPVPWWNIPHES